MFPRTLCTLFIHRIRLAKDPVSIQSCNILPRKIELFNNNFACCSNSSLKFQILKTASKASIQPPNDRRVLAAAGFLGLANHFFDRTKTRRSKSLARNPKKTAHAVEVGFAVKTVVTPAQTLYFILDVWAVGL